MDPNQLHDAIEDIQRASVPADDFSAPSTNLHRRRSHEIDSKRTNDDKSSPNVRPFGSRLRGGRRSSMPMAITKQLPPERLRKITEERDRDDEALNIQLTQLEHADRLRHSRDPSASRCEEEEVEDEEMPDDDTTADNEVQTPERALDESVETTAMDSDRPRVTFTTSSSDDSSDDDSSKRPAPFRSHTNGHHRPTISLAEEVHQMDYKDHKLFIQLDVLEVPESYGSEPQWRIRGRWIKYEESFEPRSQRWSKPKVACLTFHGLLELRRHLSLGSVLVDVAASDFESALNMMVDQLVTDGQITPEQSSTMLQLVALRVQNANARRSRRARPIKSAHLASSNSFSDFYTVQRPHEDSGAINGVESNGITQQSLRNRLESIKEDDAELGTPESSRSRAQSALSNTGSVSKQQTRRPSIMMMAANMLSTGHTVDADNQLFKRMSAGSEAALVLVGAVSFLQKPAIVFLRLSESVEKLNAIQVSLPIRYFFMMFVPNNLDVDYVEIGRSLSTLLANKRFRENAYTTRDRNDLIKGIDEFMSDSMVLPPGEWDKAELLESYAQIRSKSHVIKERRRAMTRGPMSPDFAILNKAFLKEHLESIEADPFHRTGKFFGGLKRELRLRFQHYLSDWTDGMKLKCIASIFFLFLTCLFPALTFGAIFSQETNGLLGVTETHLATSVGGIIFAILSTQPMMLIGACGPMLIFEQCIYMFCLATGYPFLELRIWVGAWALFACIITVVYEGPLLIHYVTRFSDDIMTLLISFMFVYDSVKFLKKMFTYHPIMPAGGYCLWYNAHNQSEFGDQMMFAKNKTLLDQILMSKEEKLEMMARYTHALRNFSGDPQPNAALLCCVLLFGTCVVAFVARSVRFSKYFGRQFRMVIGDLGLSLAVVIMLAIDWFVFHEELTPKLQVADGITPTLPRSWFIYPFPVSDSVIPIIAILPGFLLFMILFIETEVTEMILANHDNKLKKGTGYHFDLLLLSVMNAVCSLFGLPWLCALPVRSSEHLSSLTNYKLRAPGQKPKVLGAIEQRFTGAALHFLIGLTLLATDVLRKIPVAVMFGVFFYLGLISTTGIQMLTRIILFFVPAKYHPQDTFCTKVTTTRMHLFTAIQIVCFFGVLAVKSIKVTAFFFPLAILVCILFRHFGLPKLFTKQELAALDDHGGSDGEEAEDHAEDVYQQARSRRLSSMYEARRTSMAPNRARVGATSLLVGAANLLGPSLPAKNRINMPPTAFTRDRRSVVS